MRRDDVWIVAYKICEQLAALYCPSWWWNELGGRNGIGENEVLEILEEHEAELRKAVER